LLRIEDSDTLIFMVHPFMKYFPVAAREGVFRRPRALQIEPEEASKEGTGGRKCR
jgi:hypothetical protein